MFDFFSRWFDPNTVNDTNATHSQINSSTHCQARSAEEQQTPSPSDAISPTEHHMSTVLSKASSDSIASSQTSHRAFTNNASPLSEVEGPENSSNPESFMSPCSKEATSSTGEDPSPLQILYDALSAHFVQKPNLTSLHRNNPYHSSYSQSPNDFFNSGWGANSETLPITSSELLPLDGNADGADAVTSPITAQPEQSSSASLFLPLSSFASLRRQVFGETTNEAENDSTTGRNGLTHLPTLHKFSSRSGSIDSNTPTTVTQTSPLSLISSWFRQKDPGVTDSRMQSFHRQASSSLTIQNAPQPAYNPLGSSSTSSFFSPAVEPSTRDFDAFDDNDESHPRARRTSQLNLNTMVENILASHGFVRRKSHTPEGDDVVSHKKKPKNRKSAQSIKLSVEKRYQLLQGLTKSNNEESLRRRLSCSVTHYVSNHGTVFQDYEIERLWYEDRKTHFCTAAAKEFQYLPSLPPEHYLMTSSPEEKKNVGTALPSDEDFTNCLFPPQLFELTTGVEAQSTPSLMLLPAANFLSLSDAPLGQLASNGTSEGHSLLNVLFSRNASEYSPHTQL